MLTVMCPLRNTSCKCELLYLCVIQRSKLEQHAAQAHVDAVSRAACQRKGMTYVPVMRLKQNGRFKWYM